MSENERGRGLRKTDLDMSVSSFTAQFPDFERDEFRTVLGVTLVQCVFVLSNLIDDGL